MKGQSLPCLLLMAFLLGVVGACSRPSPAPTPPPPLLTPIPTEVPLAQATSVPAQVSVPTPTSTPTPAPTPTAVPSPTATPTETPTPVPVAVGVPATSQPVAPPPSQAVPAGDGFYKGPLFDAHLHLNPRGASSPFPSAGALYSWLDRSGVSGALAFYRLNPEEGPLRAQAAPVISGARGRVIPLVSPGPFFIQGQWTEPALRTYLRPAWIMEGFGEVGLYRPEYQGVTFDGPQMQDVLRAIGGMGGIVMVHPSGEPRGRRTALEEIEPSVRAYPNVVFLFHGGPRTLELIGPLLTRYPNVYFSWDMAPQVFVGPWRVNPMHPEPEGSGSADRFVATVHQIGRERILENALQKFLPHIGRYPDRIFWGTDLGLTWHFEEPARALVMEMARQFIGRLPADSQEEYAFRNAQRALGRFLPTGP